MTIVKDEYEAMKILEYKDFLEAYFNEIYGVPLSEGNRFYDSGENVFFIEEDIVAKGLQRRPVPLLGPDPKLVLEHMMLDHSINSEVMFSATDPFIVFETGIGKYAIISDATLYSSLGTSGLALDEHKCTEHDGQFIGVVKLQDKTCYRDLRELADEVSEFKQQRRDYSRRTAAVGAYKTTMDNHKYDTSHYGRCVL